MKRKYGKLGLLLAIVALFLAGGTFTFTGSAHASGTFRSYHSFAHRPHIVIKLETTSVHRFKHNFRTYAVIYGGEFHACNCNNAPTNNTGSSSRNPTPTMPAMSPVPSGSDLMTNSLKGLSGKDFEIQFMQEMTVHQQSAVEMAQLVPTHTKRPELITLSQRIITAQNKEIAEMTTWLSRWYQEKPLANSMSVPGMMGMMGEMDTLKQAKDATFDKQFLIMMTSHDQEALTMADLLPTKTQRPELLKLGQDIVSSQSAEIQYMKSRQQTWLKS